MQRFLLAVFICVMLGWGNWLVLPVWAAFHVPAFDGYVTDGARVLDPAQEEALEALSTELTEKTGVQLAILTVPSLEGTPVETAALETARTWGIGAKGKNTGLLILVSIQDRALRTEIGYGLEGIIPDGLSGEIQDNAMVPAFKAGHIGDGLVQGALAYAQVIARAHQVMLSPKAALPTASGSVLPKEVPSDAPALPFPPIFWFILLFILLMILTSRNKNRYRRGGMEMFPGGYFGGGFGGGSFGGGDPFGGFGGFGGGSFGGGGSSREW